jgi:two-component system chemotaxis response regulator CheB
MTRIKVLVVDDSAVVRQVVASLLSADPDIEVIAAWPTRFWRLPA